MVNKFVPQEAKKRCEAATEGPWEMFEAKGSPPIVRKVNGQRFVCEVRGSWQTMLTKDADFIAHARSDLPAALEALAEAQGKLGALEAEARGWMDSERAWYCRTQIVRILSKCSCGAPSTHPCGPNCKYPYTDQPKEEPCSCYDLHGFSPDPTCPVHHSKEGNE